MSCSAKKDANGTWHIQFRYTDWAGNKHKSQKRGFKTKKEAEEWYHRFMLQQASDSNYLSGLWTKGYDELKWQTTSFTEQDVSRLVSIDETEKYDLSLYPIPRADSVPTELREVVDNPIFIAEELTWDAVCSRAYKTGESGDGNGWRMAFSVKYNNVIVNINAKGVDPEWVYQQLVGTLTE